MKLESKEKTFTISFFSVNTLMFQEQAVREIEVEICSPMSPSRYNVRKTDKIIHRHSKENEVSQVQ